MLWRDETKAEKLCIFPKMFESAKLLAKSQFTHEEEASSSLYALTSYWDNDMKESRYKIRTPAQAAGRTCTKSEDSTYYLEQMEC